MIQLRMRFVFLRLSINQFLEPFYYKYTADEGIWIRMIKFNVRIKLLFLNYDF